ncbi:hypothetical protein CPC08DRAFT_710979 [Agrocybe pediades]|nr:hypothetical protein CPC08DRAFT_710979 [Agrocybe pediades]
MDDGGLATLTGSGYYDSPILTDSKHPIMHAAANSRKIPSFECPTVAEGLSTSLAGRTIVVDDSDNCILYTGSWTFACIPP